MPRTILIVDDDRELCDLVGELLRGEGFDVEAHHSGAGAVDLAATGGYALVILDVMLPEQNGFEILRALPKPSRFQIPSISEVYGRGVYAPRGSNPTTNTRDMIFADSINSEMASVAGNPPSGYSATFTIGLAA